MGRDSRVLVTGASGQVGRALRYRLPEARYLSRADLDVTNPNAVLSTIQGADVVIHLAAMTNVNGCEASPELANEVNAEATRSIALAAHKEDARVIFLSTDYVFDGARRRPYREEDECHPLNAYGISKLVGEKHVLAFPGNLVVRTSWIFGQGRNFVRSILGAARERGRVTVVDDQVGRPTSAADLAPAIVESMQERAVGLLHVSGDGPTCSWADLARAALAAADIDATVESVNTATYLANAEGTVAPRPAYSVLSLAKAKKLGIPLRDWRSSLREYLRESS